MQLQVQIETPSKITRKLIVRVPASVVNDHLNRGLSEVQSRSNLKGFRPGQAPLSVIKQYFGKDVKHRVYHSLIEDSLNHALRENKILAVGSPQIESPEHQHGTGEHDHAVEEDRELSYVATVEVMPEVEVKGYTGLALTRQSAEVTDDQIEKIVSGILDSHAQLIPVGSGLVGADGASTGRAAVKGDHVEVTFDGGIVTPSGVQKQEGMKGTRTIEIGSNSLIPGFEDELVGMKAGEKKTFRIQFPKDYGVADISGKDAEFAVEIHSIKEKKLPELTDEFAKEAGYESVLDLRNKAREYLTRERKEESDRKLRSDLLAALIEKNSFEVPAALVNSQSRALAQDLAGELKQQGADDQIVEMMITQEAENLRKRAESQVRASLILESIAKSESIQLSAEDFKTEMQRMADSMRMELSRLQEFYDKNPQRKDDLEFRLRQDRTVQFLLDKAKIKQA